MTEEQNNTFENKPPNNGQSSEGNTTPQEDNSNFYGDTPPPIETNQEFLCKNCGAKINFKPGTDHLVCPYCGTDNEIGGQNVEVVIEELDLLAYLEKTINDDDNKEEISVVKCDSCGAESTLKPNVTADVCPFCGSPIVVKSAHTKKIIKPRYLLPFKINKKEAMGNFKTWIKKLWFAPNKLKKARLSPDRLKGIYIPYWTFDCKTQTDYTGQKGVNYTVKTSKGTETRTRWSFKSGRVYVNFDDVLVVGTDSIPKKKADELEPWDLGSLVEYNEKYLSGFQSEAYSLSLKDAYAEGKKKMEEIIRAHIRRDIGGDKQRILTMNTAYSEPTFKHILLPIWISAYRFKNKVYQFLVNARTGEVQGERPYSAIKIALAIITALAFGYVIYRVAQ